MDDTIYFTVLDNNAKQVIQTYDGEYRNLMFLLRDKLYLDGFGECGGVGRCATCVIEARGISGNSAIMERNEPVTLGAMGYRDDDKRLSCQLFITKDLNGAEIEILD